MSKNIPSQEEEQFARIGRELANGKWLTNARVRSQRRKSAWNLLLPMLGFPLWLVFALDLGCLGWLLYAVIHTSQPATALEFFAGPIRLATALILLPSLVAAIAPALLTTNLLVYLVPPARRAMELEDRDFPDVGYGPSQRALFKAGIWLLALCIPLITIGAALG